VLKLRAALLSALAAAAAIAAAAAAGSGGHVSLVAYSTPNVAFGKLIPAFQATAAGRGVSFDQSYGAAESQVNAIVAGQPADLVDLSLPPNVDALVKAGLVDAAWAKNPYGGIVTHSVVVFVVRDGNPKHIRTWDDLVKPGVQVLTPNPFTSGGARWNILAAYGAQLREGRTQKQAVAYLQSLFHHVAAQDSSGRNALTTFLSGKGDVLLTYENEAILAQQQGKPVHYLIPKATIRIDNPLALLKKSESNAAARAFYRFLYTPQAQRLFAQTGYRPVLPAVARQFAKQFPSRPWLFTIRYLGGWNTVTPRFFDPSTGIVAKIEQGLGVSTAG
jgi:sulfate transport system substrate-binding protein